MAMCGHLELSNERISLDVAISVMPMRVARLFSRAARALHGGSSIEAFFRV